MEIISSWLSMAIVFGSIIMLASGGEILTEKAGHLNLGVPGIMYLSGFIGYLVAFKYETSVASPNGFLCVVLPIVCALISGAILGLLYSFITVSLKCNQNVMGLLLTSFGVGFGKFLCSAFGITESKAGMTATIFNSKIPGLSDIPFIGNVIFGYGFMIYLIIILIVLLHLFLKKTSIGLNLKAVGESPQTADAVGINVTKYKYIATVVGCSLCGLAGMVYSIVYGDGLWSTNNNIENIGWLAVALVIFATWKPVNLIWGSFLFGLLFWTATFLPSLLSLPKITGLGKLLEILPYLVTIIVLIINSIKKKRDNQPPESLGVPYYREER